MLGFMQTQQSDSIAQQFKNQFAFLLILVLAIGAASATIIQLSGGSFEAATQVGSVPVIPLIILVILAVLHYRNVGRNIINNTVATFLAAAMFVGNPTETGFLPLFVIASLSISIITMNQYIWTGLTIAIFSRFILAAINSTQTLSSDLATADGTVIGFFVIGTFALLLMLLMRFFIQRLETSTADARRSASLLEASADIGQSMSQVLELDQLLRSAVEIIRDRFAFYHVQVFLVDDDREYAYLRASTGEVGEQMIARQHRLRVDSNSVVGRVSQAGEPIIARDTEREGRAFNELLPDTRSELGIPIVDNEGIIGALDIQSRRLDAFTDVEIRVLTVIANQLATAIQNARLFATQARNIRENKRLFIESETSLREIQRLNRQLTRQAWEDYLTTERRVDGVTLTGQEFENRAKWSDAMLQAGQRRRAIRGAGDENNKVAVPIELRGEVIGAIEIETSESQSPEDVMDMAQAISQRLAVSLDNARLFEEAHEATAQEERIGDLVSEYQTANSVDDLLKITLTGLAETLGAESASIRISTRLDDEEDDQASTSSANGASNGTSPNGGVNT